MKPNTQAEILDARETRAKAIALFLNGDNVVLAFRANIPGANKNLPEAYMLVRYFASRFRYLNPEYQLASSKDGPYILAGFASGDAEELKTMAVRMEDKDPLGRLIDIDVHKQEKKYSRNSLRKCLVCDKPAHECIRNRRHDVETVLERIRTISAFNLKEMVTAMISEAILQELELDPKFGLVTRKTSGSHPDMDYFLMQSAKTVLLPYLADMFMHGFQAQSNAELFSRARAIGIAAEKAMLEKTGGVNAYKGMVFSLGLILVAAGYLLGRESGFDDILNLAGTLASGISSELQEGSETFGKIAFQQYGFKGARGEAESGFVHVREALALLEDESDRSMYKSLAYLIANIEDTVFLKRSGSIEKYHDFQNLFRELNDYSQVNLARLTELCIRENLSFGGSADLLVASLFLKKYHACFYGYHQLGSAFDSQPLT